MGLAILLAYIYPPIGLALAPEITASWIAVVFIFIMSGLSLKTKEIKKAMGRFGFNLFVQAFNLGVVPAIVFGITRLLINVNALP